MKFTTVILANGTQYYAQNASNSAPEQRDTLEDQKKATEAYLARNKAAFQSGYDALIIDIEKGIVVSRTQVPLIKLEWKDVPTAS